MMHSRSLRIGAVTATAASLVLALLLAAAPAKANSRPYVQALVTKTLRYGMTIVPIVKILGSAHEKGYFMALAANGKTVTAQDRFEPLVEQRMIEDRRLHPDSLTDRVYGDCGESYITLGLKSSGYPIHMTTGFTIYAFAIAYYWRGGISGPGYSYPFTFHGSLPDLNFWNGKHTSASNERHGTWSGAISTGSWAQLENGGFCFSGGPAVSGHL